jgi:magnesium transporter
VLEKMIAPHALRTLEALPASRHEGVLGLVSERRRQQWDVNQGFPDDTVGRLMELPVGTFPADTSIADAIEALREIVKKTFITYLYVTDPDGKLLGLVVMREMLLAERTQTLGDVMLGNPYHLSPEMPLQDAMKEAVQRHFPVYPVSDAEGRLVGLVRGDDLFEQNVYQLIVQAGSMVGVEKEERLATAWPRALRLRNPWLLVNLLTAFVAGAVVGLFEDTIAQVTALAAFLPVLAGQSGNTGCQALAVTLRGMALGELSEHSPAKIVTKEAFLGLLNGAVVGVLAGGAMFFFAQGQSQPFKLAVIVMAAMIGSCVASGIAGALVPIALKRVGADPATASSIFLTTATDVVSMGLLLGFATIFLI